MSRLWRLGLLCLAGFGWSSPADACWWCGGGYGYSTYYAPYVSSYAPGSGCSSCSYACAPSPCCAPCGGYGCATGNCGTGCSTTANSPPSGSLTPVPDPANAPTTTQTQSIERRLQAIERALNLTPPRPQSTYEDDFNSTRGNRSGSGSTRPNASGTGTSNEPNSFSRPLPTDPLDAEPFEPNDSSSNTRETFRPSGELGAPAPGNTGDTVIPSKKPAPAPAVDDGNSNDQTLRLDTRITSRAVSPRERRTAAGSKTDVAGRTVRHLQVDAQPRTINVARY